MKKLLFVAAIGAALLSSTMSLAEESEFYVKAQGGVSFLNRTKNKLFDTKLKPKLTGLFTLGTGYYVMDNVRADLALHYLVNPQFKEAGDKKSKSEGASSSEKTRNAIVQKGKVMALLVNGYVDVLDLSVVKVFAGAGVGMSQVKEKIRLSKDALSANQVKSALAAGVAIEEGKSWSSKKVNNFAYQLTLGASAELVESVAAELSYMWTDYGKTKKVKDIDKLGNTEYRSHNVMLGLRFNI